jgi:hypothetical protein
MEKNTVVELGGRDAIADPLTEMLRAGAQQLIKKAVELELQDVNGNIKLTPFVPNSAR